MIFTFIVPFIPFFDSVQAQSFTMTQIGSANSLTTPWDLHYGPDQYLWITERERGRILRVDPETGEQDELIRIPQASSTASQDGLLGMALHDSILTTSPYLYCSYTYLLGSNRRQRLVRFTYSITDADGTLSDPMTLIENLPASNDHNSGRLIIGPDSKLYYTIGDQGGNQNRNYCNPILSQMLPTQEEIDALDWSNYPGKILRLNLDGSIPDDNPVLEGVRSHIYSYGHRNAQGIVFGSTGLLYADEHGPNTDDEVNRIESGQNYGWPNVVGFQDDQAYDYCNWSTHPNCPSLNYQNGTCPTLATLQEETSFMADNYQEPIFSLFAVPDDYNYDNPACENAWICRPNVAPSSLGIYEHDGIPSWKSSLLVTSLKRGRVYRLTLDSTGMTVVGDTMQHFYTQNRYRDIAMDPDGKSFYLITDQGGRTSDLSGLNDERTLRNPGTILKFTLNEATSVLTTSRHTSFQIWPSPSSESLNYEIATSNTLTLKGAIHSLSGQVVRSYDEMSLQGQISLAGIPTGIYLLRLHSSGGIWQQRFIIQ